MMPFINQFFFNSKNNNKNNDNKLSVNFDIGFNNNKNNLKFGADQVRVLLFRECEWRGRKLLFDSVTAGKCQQKNHKKTNNDHSECPRNGNGVPQEDDKEACDNVNLLSELIFGTVAMTYSGPSYKIHKLNSPNCIMFTKVFPSPENNNKNIYKKNESSILINSINTELNNDKNILLLSSSSSNDNNSLNSLRKNSTCSSTCSSWDIDLPIIDSTQSFESMTSSGFGSYSSLPKRWLRAVSTSLNQSDHDDLYYNYNNNNNINIYDKKNQRHKTKYGLSIIIKLTTEQEKLMEIRLFEHAAQIESLLNRISYICIEKKLNNNDNNIFLKNLQNSSLKCTLWLLRLIIGYEKNGFPLIWHDILLNTKLNSNIRFNYLHNCYQQMYQLLNSIDTKTTNFFLSTIVTAVLTYHLGWVNTIMSTNEKLIIDNMKINYPLNPLWSQLGDLYGTFCNPPKFVHTVIVGNNNNINIINSIITFLTYFIRSAVIKKIYEYRESPENDVKDAIKIVEEKKKLLNLKQQYSNCNNNFKTNEACSSFTKFNDEIDTDNVDVDVNDTDDDDEDEDDEEKLSLKLLNNKIKKTKSFINKKIDNNLIKFNDKLNYYVDNIDDKNNIDIDNKSNIKIIVSNDKNIPIDISYNDKYDLRDNDEILTVVKKLSILEHHHHHHHQQRNDSGIDTTKSYASGIDNSDVYYANNISNQQLINDKNHSVLFTLGNDDDKIDDTNNINIINNNTNTNNNNNNNNLYTCQCSFAFTRLPSTSSQLPESVLRKILQRNFPESSKSMQRTKSTQFNKDNKIYCPKCSGSYDGNNDINNSKLLLETPTNATEVLRTCSNTIGTRGTRLRRVDSLELLRINNVIEVPMPRSKKISSTMTNENIDEFTNTLIQNHVSSKNILNNESCYTSGLVIQGLIKNKSDNNNNNNIDNNKNNNNNSWLDELKNEVNINVKFPMIDQTITESICVIGDTDNWQVGILTNDTTINNKPTIVGMSKLVSDMLEAFVYLWKKYHSPIHCLNLIEFKLRDMWLKSETLAKFLMTIDVCDVNLNNLTSSLDIDAADVPLLLAIATTHSPQITQKFGLTFT